MRHAQFFFRKNELKDIFFSTIIIAIIFSNFFGFKISVIISSVLGVIGHELSHKIFAFKRGKDAFYKANFSMLLISLLISFFGILFLAPGAVYIRGVLSKRENALISVAGPLFNLLLGIVIIPFSYLGSLINLWLSLFNMLPFYLFDGYKVFSYSKKYYFCFLTINIIALIILLI